MSGLRLIEGRFERLPLGSAFQKEGGSEPSFALQALPGNCGEEGRLCLRAVAAAVMANQRQGGL